MAKIIKYKVNIFDNNVRIKSISRLGKDLIGVVGENQSYVSSLKVYRITDGSFLWEKRIEEAVDGGTRPIFDEKNIYIPYGNARITANNPETGDERWKAPISTMLCSPLAQTAEHIMEVNNDNSNYRVIDKKDGTIVSKGKLKHKHPRYNENIYPWNGNFVAIGESRNKPVLGVYAPDSFIQNIMLPVSELIEQEYQWVSNGIFYNSAVSCLVDNHLYFGTLIGNLYRFNLTTGQFENRFSLNPDFDAAVFSTIRQLNGVVPLYQYNNMAVVDDCIYFIAEEFTVDKKMVRHICKCDHKTGVFSSEIANLKVVDHNTNHNLPYISLHILENGVGVYLSENGLVTFNLIDSSTTEIALEGWADVIKSEYRGPDNSFSGLFNFKYGKHWIVTDGKLLVMHPTGNTGELFCWELQL